MMKLTAIVAADKNFGIGLNGDMLFYIKDDLKRFKELTTDNIVIMGRRTLEALPNKEGLPNRTNLVLTRNKLEKSSITSVSSIEELEEILKEINPKKVKEEYLIGGGSLINKLWNEVDRALITLVDKEYEKVDTHIPNVLQDENFEVVNISEVYYDEETKLKYKYYEFKRKHIS